MATVVVGNVLGIRAAGGGGGGNVLRITTTALDTFVDGTPFSQTLAAAGGSGVYTNWAVTAGALPTGISINAGTGAITGTPTTPGTGSATITVTDSLGNTAGKPFAWTVTESFLLLSNDTDFLLLVSGATDKLALVAA